MATNVVRFTGHDDERLTYQRRKQGKQRDAARRGMRSSNRGARLDEHSSNRGVSGGRAARRVLMNGTAALDWSADELAFQISEDIRLAFIVEAGRERDYARDGGEPARYAEGAVFVLRLAGAAYAVHTGKPYSVGGRWYAVLYFDGLTCDVHFAVTLAQLEAVVSISPALVLVEKPAALPTPNAPVALLPARTPRPGYMPPPSAMLYGRALYAAAIYCAGN